jgi:hypothetical protein
MLLAWVQNKLPVHRGSLLLAASIVQADSHHRLLLLRFQSRDCHISVINEIL